MEPLWISLLAAVISAFVASLIGALAARVRFSASSGLRWVLDILFLLPLVMPAAIAYFFAYDFRVDMEGAFPTIPLVVFDNSIGALPIFYLSAIMGFRQVQQEWIDAARLQGYGLLGVFWRVFLPTARPWLAVGLALGFLRGAIFSLLISFLYK